MSRSGLGGGAGVVHVENAGKTGSAGRKTSKESGAMTSANVIDRRTFIDAEAFLRALHPLSGEWEPDPTLWIFRGNSESGRPLVPSAHRRRAWKEFGWPLTNHEADAERVGMPDQSVVEEEREQWIFNRYRRA